MEFVSFKQTAAMPHVSSAPTAESKELISRFGTPHCTSTHKVKGLENNILPVKVKLERPDAVAPSPTKKSKTLLGAPASHSGIVNDASETKQLQMEHFPSVPVAKVVRADKVRQNFNPSCVPLDLRKKSGSSASSVGQLQDKIESNMSLSKADGTKLTKDLDTHKFSFWTIGCTKMYVKENCDDGLKLKLRVNNALKLKLSNTHGCSDKKERLFKSNAKSKTTDPERKNGKLEKIKDAHKVPGDCSGAVASKVFEKKKVAGNLKQSSCPAQKGSEIKADSSSIAHHPCMFAIHMDNISVHLMKDLHNRQVYLIAYTNELESLTRLSVEGIETLKGIRVQEPSTGIRVLLAFPNGRVSASGSSSQPVITVEKVPSRGSLLSSLAQIDLMNRGTDSTSLEIILSDRSPSLGSDACVDSAVETQPTPPQERKVLAASPVPTTKRSDMSACFFCHEHHSPGMCFVETPTCMISDSSGCSNSHVHALASLPAQLSLVRSADGFAVGAAEDIEKGALLGPLQGEQIDVEKVKTLSNLKDIWCVKREWSTLSQSGQKKNGWNGKQRKQLKPETEEAKPAIVLSTESESLSNWCRYLRPVLCREDSNLLSVEHHGNLYFVTFRKIEKGERLLVYSPWFGELSHLPFPDDHQCCYCTLRLDNEVDFVKHCFIMHPASFQQQLEKCSECGEMFVADAESESWHGCQATKTKRGTKPWRCRRRRRKMTKGDKNPLTCCECGKCYASSQLLSQHLLSHESYFRYFCKFCQKGFHDKSNLKVHVLIHTGVRPFRCQQPHCTASFTTKQCLQIHYRKLHGFSDSSMPTILREVPFTFEAHMAESSQA